MTIQSLDSKNLIDHFDKHNPIASPTRDFNNQLNSNAEALLSEYNTLKQKSFKSAQKEQGPDLNELK